MLEPLLERLDNVREISRGSCSWVLAFAIVRADSPRQIVYNEFPMPRVPSLPVANSFDTSISLVPSSHQTVPTEPSSQTQLHNKENAPPQYSTLEPPSRAAAAAAPPFSSSVSASASADRIPESQMQSGLTNDALPPLLLATLKSIQSTLRSYFSQKPPHTIQRLAELILYPTSHYRTLPAYLRAVDRVVSVSSGADIFPLPVSMPLPGGLIDMSLANGVNGAGAGDHQYSDSSLGSDESLGGALLTPISWLSNASIPGNNNNNNNDILAGETYSTYRTDWNSGSAGSPNGDSLTTVPPRESGGVTQGELIRQEQEAGVVPTSQQHIQRHPHPHPSVIVEEEEVVVEPQSEEGEELPHARGPAILGVEDMGLQDGRGVQVSLTRSPTGISASPEGTGAESEGHNVEQAPESDRLGSDDAPAELDRDGDGDIVIGDLPNKSTQEETQERKDLIAESAASSGSTTGATVSEGASGPLANRSESDNDKMDS